MPGCEVARLQGWEVARLQVYRQSKGIFLLVLLWFIIGLYGCFCTIGRVYRSGDGGGGAVVVWCGGGAGGCGGAGGGEGVAGDTPLSSWMVGTIRGFGMRKFFFEFWGRLAWCGAECGGEGVEG